jgi:hypothetical protein
MTTINGLKIGTRLRVKTFSEGAEPATVVGPATESWCARLPNGRVCNVDINEICDIEVAREDQAEAAKHGIVRSERAQS